MGRGFKFQSSNTTPAYSAAHFQSSSARDVHPMLVRNFTRQATLAFWPRTQTPTKPQRRQLRFCALVPRIRTRRLKV
eukprot:scaffold319_cov244-Pinguiococcus_pyrenoidosus.AAC.12